MGLSDQKIVELIKEGNDKAFVFLNKSYFPRLQKHVLINSGTPEEAKDLYHDVLIILIKYVKKEDFELRSELFTFFFGIAKKQLHLVLRKKKNRHVEFDEEEHTIEENLNLKEIDIVKNKIQDIINSHFRKLNKRCRKILGIHSDGGKWEEIAKAIGTKSQSNVWKLTSLCRTELRKRVWSDPEYLKLKKYYDDLSEEL